MTLVPCKPQAKAGTKDDAPEYRGHVARPTTFVP